ncbi:MAG: MATE family efflux transporter [Burkholderiaceae bacterium]
MNKTSLVRLPGSTPAARWRWRVLRLAWPIVLANLTVPILSAVDTAIAGHLGQPAALGAVALGGLIFNFVFWGFGFLRMGTTALTARAHGAGDGLGLRASLLRGLAIALLIGVLLLVLRGPLVSAALDLLGGGPVVQQLARDYTYARLWSAPLALGNFVLLGYLLGVQHVRVGLALQLLINVVNVVAVLVFVHALDLGVPGIGLATALADVVGFIAGAAWVWSRRLRSLPPVDWRRDIADPRALRRLMAMNGNLFVRTMCVLAAFAWFTRAGARQGDAVLAANAVLLNFQTFASYALDGFAHAAETLVGAAVGARHREALRWAIRTTMGWSVVGALGFCLVYAIGGPTIVRLLTNQPGVVALALVYLPWAVILPLVSAAGFQLDGVFIGAMRTRELMLAMAVCLAGFIVLALGLQGLFGNHGLWAAFTAFMTARGVTLWMLLPHVDETIEGEAVPRVTI